MQMFSLPIFLDLKIKDIPATAERAISNILKLNVAMTTVHITGGRAMLESVVKIKKETGSNTELLGVTQLTSLDNSQISEFGINEKIEDNVNRLSRLSRDCGLDGIVCSPKECSIIRKIWKQL